MAVQINNVSMKVYCGQAREDGEPCLSETVLWHGNYYCPRCHADELARAMGFVTEAVQ